MPKSKSDPKKFSLFEYDKELAVAFKGDCEEFLEDFEKLNSFSFDDFSKVWQTKKFTYVFAEQSYALLLKDLCENYFYIVKKFITFPKNLYTQIGAFYMLYGLYYKQPLRAWVKIRLTLDEYKKIVDLIEAVKTHRQFDAVYIFAKMKVDQAFLYTAHMKPLGPEERFVRGYELYYDDTFESAKTMSALSKFHELLPNHSLVNDLEKTNNEYQEQLKKYAETCPSIAPFASTVVEKLRKANLKFAQGPSQSSEKTKNVESKVKSVRQQIKEKAMANKNAVYRGLRKVKTATDEDMLDRKMDTDGDT